MQGTIKFFNEQKGFGFIMPEDGSQDLFFHITQCDESYELPQEGDAVSYSVGEGRDGRPAATGVSFLGAAGSSAGAQDEEYED
ncbi:MAG: cold shock domain-containing protein [Candidatus Peribacteria bacterium]|nr:MAG: cold shock domain-containing protein [Candidatus Peribacteria bacterium]